VFYFICNHLFINVRTYAAHPDNNEQNSVNKLPLQRKCHELHRFLRYHLERRSSPFMISSLTMAPYYYLKSAQIAVCFTIPILTLCGGCKSVLRNLAVIRGLEIPQFRKNASGIEIPSLQLLRKKNNNLLLIIINYLFSISRPIISQGVTIACYAEPCISYGWVACLSPRPSVCLSHAGTVSQWRKIRSRSLHRRISQVLAIRSLSRNSKGFTLSEDIKWVG